MMPGRQSELSSGGGYVVGVFPPGSGRPGWRYEMSFRVVVDFDRCESNALCMAAAPEVFEVRDDDFL